MNVENAKKMISGLSSGVFAGRDWFGPERAVVYFAKGYARNPVEDYGLSSWFNSGKPIEETVTITDRYMLKALRKAY